MRGDGPAGWPTAPYRWRLIGSLGLRASAWTALIHDQSPGDMALLRPHPKAPKSPQSPGTCLTAAGGQHLLGRVENLVRAERLWGSPGAGKGLPGVVSEQTDPRRMWP